MDPILFDFGIIQIRYYGLMYVVGIVVGTYLFKKEVLRGKLTLTDDEITNIVMWVVLGGILGARVYYVLFNLDYYLSEPMEIPAIWHGGLAIHGGMIGATIAAHFYIKKLGVPFWQITDMAAPSVILGQAFGRFGNFMNGDAHGYPTDLPFGVIFPIESIAGREFPGIPTHPVMIYELLINFSIFLFLWFYLRHRPHKHGYIFAVYFILYSLGRCFVESFRADSLMLGDLRAAQVASILLVIILTAVIVKQKLYTDK